MPDNLFRVGNGAGFSGDRIDAPIPVVRTLIAKGGPAALFLEVLAERTIALAQLEKRRDPEAGYEPMLERLLAPILADCAAHRIPVLGNFGAANPPAAARAVARLALRLGLAALRIAVISGDDVKGKISLDTAEVIESDASIAADPATMISANAYLGAMPLAAALLRGADIVIAGRVADPALALAPLIAHFGWNATDWQHLAAGVTAGHLLECGAQVSGGVFYDPGFKDIPDPANIGFPIAEIDARGNLVITKADDTGGLVDLRTVKEQLLYEVHDPAAYVTPDVVLDISEVRLAQVGPDRVAVSGMRGHKAPETLKVTACYEAGFLGEGEISLAGPNALARARLAGEVLKERINRRGLPVRTRVDLIGIASVHDDDTGTLARAYAGPEPEEVRVRLAVAGEARDTVEQAVREVLAMLCCGPAGSSGARLRTVPRIVTRSFLVPRGSVPTEIALHRASELAA
ncbi:MAG TPA: acyclic terpene utilization AtuA family protein [Acetobacteraceae bacterium]|jgi:hypothetical protein|nr:acyclic terpene utilization AtuA family protein [Acetobacteraceae bacterium]